MRKHAGTKTENSLHRQMTRNRVSHPLAGRKHLYHGWLVGHASWRIVGVRGVQLSTFFVVRTAAIEPTFGEAAEEEAEEL